MEVDYRRLLKKKPPFGEVFCCFNELGEISRKKTDRRHEPVHAEREKKTGAPRQFPALKKLLPTSERTAGMKVSVGFFQRVYFAF